MLEPKEKYWFIKLWGWHVVRASTGEIALEIAKRHKK